MTSPQPKTRLYKDGPLEKGALLPLEAASAHHVLVALRLGAGDTVSVFNGRDGEWVGTLETVSRKSADVRINKQIRPQIAEPDIWLLFAPLKKTATDYTVEKATELGAARLIPVSTRRTETKRLNVERLNATARDAAQQSERLSIPAIDELRPLGAVLSDWDPSRTLFVAAERYDLMSHSQVERNTTSLFQVARRTIGPHAILIGPEGGFETEELDGALKLPFVVPVNLGPRILRAETAAIVALTIWQTAAGEMKEKDTP